MAGPDGGEKWDRAVQLKIPNLLNAENSYQTRLAKDFSERLGAQENELIVGGGRSS